MPPHTNISNASEIAELLDTFSVTAEEIDPHGIAAKDLQKNFEDSRLSVIEIYMRNTVETETEEFISAFVSDICSTIPRKILLKLLITSTFKFLGRTRIA